MGDYMNKFQKVCLMFSILAGIDIAMDVLLNLSFILRFIEEGSLVYKVYIFMIGISAFTNLLLFKKEE